MFKPLYLQISIQSLTISFCSLISKTGRVNLTPVVHWAGPVDCQPTALWCGFMVSQNICCIYNHNAKKAKEAGTAEKKLNIITINIVLCNQENFNNVEITGDKKKEK